MLPPLPHLFSLFLLFKLLLILDVFAVHSLRFVANLQDIDTQRKQLSDQPNDYKKRNTHQLDVIGEKENKRYRQSACDQKRVAKGGALLLIASRLVVIHYLQFAVAVLLSLVLHIKQADSVAQKVRDLLDKKYTKESIDRQNKRGNQRICIDIQLLTKGERTDTRDSNDCGVDNKYNLFHDGSFL